MEDFAKKYWEDFEELSVDILKLIFKEYKEKDIKKTKGRKDGGYDAYVLISDSKQNAYKAISESKLRKLSNKDLPLSDFAKTLIISINLCANKVYIFTNLHFSIETQNRLSKFSRGTNIDVQLFDINKICDWIPQLQKASLQKYPENFISQLQKSVVDHPDNILFESEGIINQIEIYDLLGKEKQQKLNEALKQLERKTGIYIVRGRQGSGKTVFINNLVTKLNPQEYNYIDISTITDINDLFIELLSIIWHVDSLIISQFSFEDIENISDYMIDEADKQNLCVTLSKILVKENLVEIESNRLQARYGNGAKQKVLESMRADIRTKYAALERKCSPNARKRVYRFKRNQFTVGAEYAAFWNNKSYY